MFSISIDGCEAISEIFDLEISQKEGELAVAQAQIRDDIDFSRIAGKIAAVLYDDTVLMRGVIQEYPSYMENNFIDIRIISTYSKEALNQLIEDFKNCESYNSIFDNGIQDIAQITEALPSRVYFSRLSDDVRLSEIYPKAHKYEITPDDYWNFSIRKVREAYSRIDVSVTAQWVYSFFGITDLFPLIANLFPEKRINSINNISKHWWKLLRSLPHSCYKIANSKLEEDYPINSLHSETFDIDGQPIRIKRFWFRGMLDLCWDYRQKMEETIHFFLSAKSDGGTKILNFNLGAVPCDKKSFFKTIEGQKCLKTAAHRAFNHLLASQRNIEMTLIGDFNKLSQITVADTVQIKNKHISTIGKVVQTVIKVTDSKRYVKLKIAASSSNNISLSSVEDFFKHYVDQWDIGNDIADGDIVEDINIENPPDFQIDTAHQQRFKNVSELKTFLANLPTKIRIRLKNLNTTKCKRNELKIDQPIEAVRH